MLLIAGHVVGVRFYEQVISAHPTSAPFASRRHHTPLLPANK